MEDRDGNGIPDVIDQMARASAAAKAGEGGLLAHLPLTAGDYREAPKPDLSHIPPPPRQPSQRARDLVFAYTGSQSVLRIIGGAFLALGSVFAVIFCAGLPVDIALAFAGQRATGTVTGTHVQTNVEINGQNPILIEYTYRFENVAYQGESPTLDGALLVRARPGATVPIEVLPFAPDFSRIEGETYSSFGYFVSFVLIFPLVGALLLASAIRSNRREIRAFVHGLPIIAKVSYAGFDHTTTVNGRHPFQIRWEHEVNGSTYKGTLTHMEMRAIGDLVVGGEILVLYDPKDPSISTVWVG